MKDINKIILVGRLGNDPVKYSTKTGLAVAHFTVATAQWSKSKEEEETQWHRIVAWGKQGENCVQYLKKGQSVFVEGVLKSRKFEGKDGVERTSFEVHADQVSFLGGGSRTVESTATEPVAQTA